MSYVDASLSLLHTSTRYNWRAISITLFQLERFVSKNVQESKIYFMGAGYEYFWAFASGLEMIILIFWTY